MDISPSQLSSNGNATRVETNIRIAVFNTYSAKKVKPSLSGALWADIGLRYFLRYETGKQRDKLFMQPGYVCLAALLYEGYPSQWDVNVAHRVQVGFRQPTPLIPSNLEAVGQKSSHRLWLLGNALANQGLVFGRQRGFDFTGDALDPKLATWIGGSVTTPDRLFHNQPEGFQFEQGSIMARTVFHDINIVELAPFDIGLRVFAGEEAWSDDPATRQKDADGAPSDEIAKATLRVVAIAFVDEHWNPLAPCFLGDKPAMSSLVKCPLSDKLQNLSDVEAAADAEASTLIANFPADGMPVLNPPKAPASVTAGHVSPTVTT